MAKGDFYTLRGYDRHDKGSVSHAMEDYLEMISRSAVAGEDVRVNRLAMLLNVSPPAASKMVARLRDAGLVQAESYGLISLTESGRALGAYLLHRHDVLHRFFCKLNGTEDELELVEKIEHFIDERTVQNMHRSLGR